MRTIFKTPDPIAATKLIIKYYKCSVAVSVVREPHPTLTMQISIRRNARWLLRPTCCYYPPHRRRQIRQIKAGPLQTLLAIYFSLSYFLYV